MIGLLVGGDVFQDGVIDAIADVVLIGGQIAKDPGIKARRWGTHIIRRPLLANERPEGSWSC